MQAENKTTGYNRYIRVTGIGPDSPLDTIELNIRYNGEGGACHDITLDHHIIPRILATLNDPAHNTVSPNPE